MDKIYGSEEFDFKPIIQKHQFLLYKIASNATKVPLDEIMRLIQEGRLEVGAQTSSDREHVNCFKYMYFIDKKEYSGWGLSEIELKPEVEENDATKEDKNS